MTAPPRGVAGVDGCRGGWVAADDDGVEVVATFAEVAARPYAVIGVDMPIGLPDAGPRACDVEARRRIGQRRSSVFPAPRRAALELDVWSAGLGLSRQTFNLLAKMREVDAVVRADGPGRDRVVEVHPEVSFAAMTGRSLAHPKRRPEGRAERLAALEPAADPARLPGAAPDDVLDAYAVLWSARRWKAGVAVVLGDGALDATGLPMRIIA